MSRDHMRLEDRPEAMIPLAFSNLTCPQSISEIKSTNSPKRRLQAPNIILIEALFRRFLLTDRYLPKDCFEIRNAIGIVLIEI